MKPELLSIFMRFCTYYASRRARESVRTFSAKDKANSLAGKDLRRGSTNRTSQTPQGQGALEPFLPGRSPRIPVAMLLLIQKMFLRLK